MTVTTNEFGQQNMFAKEPQMYVDKTEAERYGYETYAERAEKLNGRTAMMGFVAALISYAFTGKLFFGILWINYGNGSWSHLEVSRRWRLERR